MRALVRPYTSPPAHESHMPIRDVFLSVFSKARQLPLVLSEGLAASGHEYKLRETQPVITRL